MAVDLPPELVVHILSFLYDHDAKRAVSDLMRCMLVSRSMMQLARDDAIWSQLLLASWPLGEVEDDVKKQQGYLSVFERYKRRRMDDDRATRTIVEIAKAPCRRLRLLEQIRIELGERVLSRCTYDASLLADWERSEPEYWMTARYWANEAKEGILRDRGIRMWTEIRDNPDQDQTAAFERGLLAFVAFRGVDTTTSIPFDDWAYRLTNSLGPPGQATTWLEQLALQTVSFMNDHGLESASSSNFHSLDNHFLDVVCLKADITAPNGVRLSSTRGVHSGTLPMSLVCIFCAIARRLPANYGIEVCPVGFPGVMLAGIREKGTEEWTYVNVSVDGGKILRQEEMRAMLDTMGVAFDPEFLRPATAREMCVRTAQNILVSIRSGDRGRLVGARAPTQALHALATCLYIFSAPERVSSVAQWIVSLTQAEYPSDVGFVEREIVPRMRNELDDVEMTCQAIRSEDEHPETTVKKRTSLIEWRVGHVFRHKLFGYIAAITGWDETCEAGEEWIQAMQVDRLPRGRHQPFYHVTTVDGSTRYVAQENVTNQDDVPEEAHNQLRYILPLGRFLRCPQRNSSGRLGFVKSVETAQMYPDS